MVQIYFKCLQFFSQVRSDLATSDDKSLCTSSSAVVPRSRMSLFYSFSFEMTSNERQSKRDCPNMFKYVNKKIEPFSIIKQ